MASAFQANAFQNNAFQIEGAEPVAQVKEVTWPGTRKKKKKGPDIGLIRELQEQWRELAEASALGEKEQALARAKDTAAEIGGLNEEAKALLDEFLASPKPDDTLLRQIEQEEEELEDLLMAIA